MTEQSYYINAAVHKSVVLSVIADLHNADAHDVVASLRRHSPDFILVIGDILQARIGSKNIYEHIPHSTQHLKYAENAVNFLGEAVKIAPVILSTGNHELYFDGDDASLLDKIGVIFLDNTFVKEQGIVFGGLSSPYWALAGTGIAKSKDEHAARWEVIYKNYDIDFLDEFENQDDYKILLCHHPEIYDKYLKDRAGINLILSGHTHGGQIRLFGRGLYAYGQGWFPKYTKGIYDGKLIISAGLANTSRVPRLFNPPEVVYVELKSCT